MLIHTATFSITFDTMIVYFYYSSIHVPLQCMLIQGLNVKNYTCEKKKQYIENSKKYMNNEKWLYYKKTI